MPDSQTAPKPHDTLNDDGGCTTWWLADAWSKDDIIEEWDWLELTPERLREGWMAYRWTTEEERADPDRLYDLFMCDPDDIDTSVYYWPVPAGSKGAARYWTTEP